MLGFRFDFAVSNRPTEALFFVHAAMLTTVILCLAGGLGFLAVSKPALLAGQMDGWFRVTAPSTQKPWWM